MPDQAMITPESAQAGLLDDWMPRQELAGIIGVSAALGGPAHRPALHPDWPQGVLPSRCGARLAARAGKPQDRQPQAGRPMRGGNDWPGMGRFERSGLRFC